MVEFRPLCLRVRLHRAVVLGATALISNCSDYESCEATLSCPSAGLDSGTGGALGAAGSRSDGSVGTGGAVGSASTGSAGTAGSAGAAGSGGDPSDAGDASDASDSGDAAGGSSDAGADSPDGPVDVTPPTVVRVTPTNGAKGIAKNANIVIVFSERMDPTKTLAAYSSTDLPAAGVTFTWSADGTTLTIDPSADLTYQADTAPSTAQAKSYAFAIGATATDVGGNRLAMGLGSKFSTLRRVSQRLIPRGTRLTREIDTILTSDCVPGAPIFVGSNGQGWLGGLLEYDFAPIPPDVHTFEQAQLQTGVFTTGGEPFGASRLGQVVCDHTNFTLVNVTLEAAPLRRMGILWATPTDTAGGTLDVLSAIVDDYAQRQARSNRTQFRITFSIQNPDLETTYNYIRFDCYSGLTLLLTYLAP
jgi:hypothetical protein